MLTKIISLIEKRVPDIFFYLIINFCQFLEWKKRNFLDNSPQFIKEKIFMKYSNPNGQWIESGTYKGMTTKFLSQKFNSVHSIEPCKILFSDACVKLNCVTQNIFSEKDLMHVAISKNKKIILYNGLSVAVMSSLLPKLRGDINFWLDGHFSGGNTFKADKECYVQEELQLIKNNLSNFKKITILIDDVRCFLLPNKFKDYPDVNYLVEWAKENNFSWRIEHDIFVMLKNVI